MMPRIRWIELLIIFGWLLSMSWLVATKVLPPLRTGNPPVTQSDVVNHDNSAQTARWQISWQDRNIGFAQREVSRRDEETVRISTRVEFHELPVEEMGREILGTMMPVVQHVFGEALPRELNLTVISHFDFDRSRELRELQSEVHIDRLGELVRLHGTVKDGELTLVTYLRTNKSHQKGERFEPVGLPRTVELPRDSLPMDAFSPSPRLPNLSVGQTWSYRSYQALSPYQPYAVVEATVARREAVSLDGKTVNAFVVVYRGDAGSGISITRRPIATAWVDEDGTVLRQDLQFASLSIRFERSDREPDVDEPHNREE
jgi:hypothetical protein